MKQLSKVFTFLLLPVANAVLALPVFGVAAWFLYPLHLPDPFALPILVAASLTWAVWSLLFGWLLIRWSRLSLPLFAAFSLLLCFLFSSLALIVGGRGYQLVSFWLMTRSWTQVGWRAPKWEQVFSPEVKAEFWEKIVLPVLPMVLVMAGVMGLLNAYLVWRLTHRPEAAPSTKRRWRLALASAMGVGLLLCLPLIHGQVTKLRVLRAIRQIDAKVQGYWQAAEFIRNVRHKAAMPVLIGALRHRSVDVRSVAAEALGSIGDKRAVPALLRALKDRERSVRFACVQALGKIGDRRAMPPLTAMLLKRGEDWLRHKATLALGQIGGDEVVPVLLSVLNDESQWVRIAACEALGNIGNAKAVKPLIQKLNDEFPAVRWTAYEALGKLKDPRAASARQAWLKERGQAAEIDRLVARLFAPYEDEKGWQESQAARQQLVRMGKAVVPALIQAMGGGGHYRVTRALSDIGAPAVPALVQALKSKDPSRRFSAAKVLIQRYDRRAIEPLIKLLTHPNPKLRSWAASTLYYLPDPRVVMPLCRLLSDKSKEVRQAAALALADILEQIPDRRAVEPLLKVLNDSKYGVRIWAVRALGKIGDRRAVEPLIKKLKDKEHFVRCAAADALGELKDPRAIEPLRALLAAPKEQKGTRQENEQRALREKAILALAKLGDQKVLPNLMQMANDPNEWTRSAAAQALGELKGQEAKAKLIILLNDPEPYVRYTAVNALGNLGDRSVVPLLIERLRDPDGAMRGWAAEALGNLGDRRALKPLLNMLTFWESGRLGAARAVGKLRSREAVPALIALLGDYYPEVREAAAEALGSIGDARAVEPLIKALKDSKWTVRKAAAEALGNLGDRRALPTLKERAADDTEDGYVREAAAQAVAKLGQ